MSIKNFRLSCCFHPAVGWCTLFCFWAMGNALFGQTPAQKFDAANQFYQDKNFEKAAESYESLYSEGFQSPELFYNWGNACFRLGKIGCAVLNYERALKLDPGMEDARYNLELANAARLDDFETLPPFFLRKWWRSTIRLASERVWTGIALFLFWAGMTGLVIWLVGQSREVRKRSFIAGLFLVLLSTAFFAVAQGRARYEKHSGEAIILVPKLELKSGPDEAATPILTLHEGTKVEILDEIGAWFKVKLPNGEQGWVPANTFEEI
ncbi:MAG: hypothetical protein D6714_06705 [Bacteroidetes bacterium]|nr:MAG: hypothetical protein D6714_06705 [Bacteroidota bacterium]